MAEMVVNGLTWLEIDQIVGTGWKWLKMAGIGFKKNTGLVGYGLKGLLIAGNGCNGL